MLTRRKHRMSMIYRPVNVGPHSSSKSDPSKPKKNQKTDKSDDTEPLSKSLRLMLDNGIIRHSSFHGAFHLLPLGMRSLDKLIKIIDAFMEKADCQKIQMPMLTSSALWEATGRLEDCGTELMKLSDRHAKNYILSPTHEEAICDLVNTHPVSYRQLPLRLYQITDKFRDERRPRFGLMRGRQFMMKDLYTFDTNEGSAMKTYEQINEIYGHFFHHLGVNVIRASGSTGTIGGKQSHEFHIQSDIGEDRLLTCGSCHQVFNEDLLEVSQNQRVITTDGRSSNTSSVSIPKCIHCESTDLSASTSIEIGHTFLLGRKYTEVLKTSYVNENSKPVLMEMGCYGLGVSRLLAAVVEISSVGSEIRWPTSIAPYLLSIIPPKAGSKEEPIGQKMSEKIQGTIREILGNDLIIDDRIDQTVGKRLLDAKRLGIPFIAVFGKSVSSFPKPLIELHDVNNDKVHMMQQNDVFNFLYDAKSRLELNKI